MENSPQQAGPDQFSVLFQVKSGRFDGVVLKRSAPNLYVALAEVREYLQERLKRHQTKEIKRVRKLVRKQKSTVVDSEQDHLAQSI
jgi:hypothetical protein